MWNNTKQGQNKEIQLNIIFLHEKVIDIFHNNCYIPTIEILSFHLSNVLIIGSMKCVNTKRDSFKDNKKVS